MKQSFSLNEATQILHAAEQSGLTVDECVRQLRAAGGIKEAIKRVKTELGDWPKKVRTSDERR